MASGLEINSRLDVSHESRWLFLTAREWVTGLVFAACIAGIMGVLTAKISGWIAITAFVVALTTYHMGRAAKFIVPLPHLAILISALEYVGAASMSYYFPPVNPVYDISSILPYYLSYSAPVVIATCVGWSLSLVGLRLPLSKPNIVRQPTLLFDLDVFLVLGLVATVVGRLLPASGFEFALLLISYLRFVGVYGRMILRETGWRWRLTLVLMTEAFFAAETAMFNPLLLWSAWSFAIWLYAVKPSHRRVMLPLIAATLLLPGLQEAKWRLRGGLSDFAEDTDISASSRFERTFAWVQYLTEGLQRTLTLTLGEEFVGDTLVRYNQGWIVSRIMFVVPESEPYAMGDTLVEAARAALLPRLIDSNKIRAGGQEKMARFAGMELNENTSMNLGYAGEMYANFGLLGGIFASGLYAFAFGLIFRWICLRAFKHALWWSFVPYIFFSVLKGDDGVAEVLNWTFTIFGCYSSKTSRHPLDSKGASV
jgi:hypothetical protein